MLTVLLIIIYISFISLGLPDALLGSAWPVMNSFLEVPLSYAGILSMIVTAGTIFSSALSDRAIHRFGTGPLTAVSVAMTALALLGYSVARSFWFLCLMAIPLGLGAGAVDAALNNFVALHYKARHMNWLHCFWGIGATLGPVIMAFFLLGEEGWRLGYRTVGGLQVVLALVLFSTLRLWKAGEGAEEEVRAPAPLGMAAVLRLPYAKATLLTFFCYCSLEILTGLWGTTFLVMSRGIPVQTAARWVSFYYLGITVGRFLSGVFSMRWDNRSVIRAGFCLMSVGGLLLLFSPLRTGLPAGLILLGLGCAPIFPGLLHETPRRFGKDRAQSLMGIQMASAYVGSTLAPPAFGLLAQEFSPGLLPVCLCLLIVPMVVLTERINRGMDGKNREETRG